MGDAVTVVTEAKVAYERTGARDPKVTEALSRVEGAVARLDSSYGKAAARKAKGGELSGKEKQQLAQMRAKQKELQAKLDEVENKANSNSTSIKGLKEIRRSSDTIYRSRDTLGDFLAALITLRIIDGMLWGWHWWWGPWGVWVPDYTFIYVDVYYYDAIDVIDYDWDLVDYEIDVADLDLNVSMDEAELDTMDAFVDSPEFDYAPADLTHGGELDASELDQDNLTDLESEPESLPETTFDGEPSFEETAPADLTPEPMPMGQPLLQDDTYLEPRDTGGFSDSMDSDMGMEPGMDMDSGMDFDGGGMDY